jgi:hypothetical protein
MDIFKMDIYVYIDYNTCGVASIKKTVEFFKRATGGIFVYRLQENDGGCSMY